MTKIISPNDNYQYFFGYYDLQPYSDDGRFHLAHRVSFMDRLPVFGDECEVGYIELGGGFVSIGKTLAWNFQQGAMLNWFGEDSIIYNSFDGDKYCSIIKNISSKKEQVIPRPLACLSKDRTKGLSINFSRIYDFRPGYGYAGIKDINYFEKAPGNDGIYLINLKDGTEKLIISYTDIKEKCYEKHDSDKKLVINHITFNPSANRFLFLVRSFPNGDNGWGTQLIISDLEGNMRPLTGFTVNSHYDWKDDENFIIFGMGEWDVFFVNIDGQSQKLNDPLIAGKDLHCLYSPDKRFFSGDGYPDKDNMRPIYLHNIAKKQTILLDKFYSVPTSVTDIRCDLHVRWRPDGKALSFDTTHNGKRQIAEMDIKEILLNG